MVRGGGLEPDSVVAFMLDQCHNVEDKIPGQIRSVLNVQEMTARALLVDASALTSAQESGDVLAANAVFMDAFYTDVRGDLAEWRESRGLPGDPMRAYAESGYQRTDREGTGRWAAGWLGGLSGSVRVGAGSRGVARDNHPHLRKLRCSRQTHPRPFATPETLRLCAGSTCHQSGRAGSGDRGFGRVGC